MNERGFSFVVWGSMILTVVLSLATVIGAIWLIVWLVTNPATIGEFFGSIVNGFNAARG